MEKYRLCKNKYNWYKIEERLGKEAWIEYPKIQRSKDEHRMKQEYRNLVEMNNEDWEVVDA